MNSRARKRRVVEQQFVKLFSPSPFDAPPELSVQEREWLDFAPIGCEFGSSDYERLIEEAAQNDRELLAKVALDMRATRRKEPPQAGDEERWIETHDTHTGSIFWTRLDLADEWNRLQLKIRGVAEHCSSSHSKAGI